jgi:hypothetical protein
LAVGAQFRLDECERTAGELNAERRIMRDRIEAIDIIEVGDATVRTAAGLRLGLDAPREKGDLRW